MARRIGSATGETPLLELFQAVRLSAENHRDAGRPGRAVFAYRRAVRTFADPPLGGPTFGGIRALLWVGGAEVFLAAERYAGADRLLRSALAEAVSGEPPDHRTAADACGGLAHIAQQVGDETGAAHWGQLCSEALAAAGAGDGGEEPVDDAGNGE